MKSLKLIIIGIMLFLGSAIQAQVNVSVTISSPPPWGLIGYPDVRYYFLPDVRAYYDIQTSMFICREGGGWVYKTSLPGRYTNYNLYNGYKVAITDYVGDAPYKYFSVHQVRYARGNFSKDNKIIREISLKDNSKKKDNSVNEKSVGLANK